MLPRAHIHGASWERARAWCADVAAPFVLGALTSALTIGWLWAFAAACSFDVPDAGDYKAPALGIGGASGVQYCKQFIDLPCGWVYDCGPDPIELCLPWDDRAEIPHLKEAAESQFGRCEISTNPRFAGTPLCKYECPPTGPGCNAISPGGCYCLDEAP